MMKLGQFLFSRCTQLYLLAWGVLTAFGTFYFISDSEFWPISVAREFGSTPVAHSVLLYKPLFHALLRVPYFFTLGNVAHIYFAKVIFAGIGAACFLLILRLTGQQLGRATAGALGVLLLSSQVYFSQFFRIRSDVLSLFISMVIISQVIRLTRKSEIKLLDYTLVWGLAALLLAATPKAIYNLLILSVWTVAYCQALGWGARKSAGTVIKWFFLGPAAIVCSGIGVSQFFELDLFQALVNAANYYISSYKTPNVGLGASDGFYVLRSLQIDAFIWVMAGVAWIALLFRKKKSPFVMAIMAAAPVTLGAMWLHNQRLPFFWAGLWPFLIWPLAAWVGAWPRGGRRQLVFLSLLFFYMGYQFRPALWWTSNRTQMAKIHDLEQLLSDFPKASVFDGQGILPRSNLTLAFYSPGDFAGNDEANNTLERQLPEVVIYLQKLVLGEPRVSKVLDWRYHPVGAGVWFRNDLPMDVPAIDTEYIGRWFSFEPPGTFN